MMASPLVPDFRLTDDDWQKIAIEAGPFDHLPFGEYSARLDLERWLDGWKSQQQFTRDLQQQQAEHDLLESLADQRERNGQSLEVLEPLLDEAAHFRKVLPMLQEEAFLPNSNADKPHLKRLRQAIGQWWRDDLGRKVGYSQDKANLIYGPFIRSALAIGAAVDCPLKPSQFKRIREEMDDVLVPPAPQDGSDELLANLVSTKK